MQAIGLLSRREHSRQELRAKLLAALRKRVREEAAFAAATEGTSREIAEALRHWPSNGIDDAFGPAPALSPVAALVAVAVPPSSSPSPLLVRTVASARTPTSPPTRVVVSGGESFLDTGPEPGIDSGRDPGPNTRSDADLDLEADPEAEVDALLDWLVANKYLSDLRFVESRVHARLQKQGAAMINHELARHGLTLDPDQAASLRETEFARAHALWSRKFGELAVDARARAKQARFLVSRGFASDVVRRIVGGQEID